MNVLVVVCRARIHDSDSARRAGCVCPVGWASPYRRATQPRRPESVRNLRGPTRLTVTEADWVAVDRAIAGDRCIVLAKVERDEAIDRLDQIGLSARQVAARLGITMRTVYRRRAERRAERGAA